MHFIFHEIYIILNPMQQVVDAFNYALVVPGFFMSVIGGVNGIFPNSIVVIKACTFKVME